MLTILNQAAFSTGALREQPYRWGPLTPTFADPATAALLADTFPSGLLSVATRGRDEPGDKSYHMHTVTLVERSGRVDVAGLPEPWSALVDETCSGAYRTAVRTATGVDVDHCELEVRLCEYPPDGWLSPHTDRPEKIVTHVLYFNPVWEQQWGGQFTVLNSSRDDDVHHRVDPRLNTSVLMVRSDHSWHAVAPVRADVAHTRRSLLVHFTETA